jgi:hypothetical protein
VKILNGRSVSSTETEVSYGIFKKWKAHVLSSAERLDAIGDFNSAIREGL